MKDTSVIVSANGKEAEHFQAEIYSVGFGGFYFKTGSLKLVAILCFSPLSAGVRSMCHHTGLTTAL